MLHGVLYATPLGRLQSYFFLIICDPSGVGRCKSKIINSISCLFAPKEIAYPVNLNPFPSNNFQGIEFFSDIAPMEIKPEVAKRIEELEKKYNASAGQDLLSYL